MKRYEAIRLDLNHWFTVQYADETDTYKVIGRKSRFCYYQNECREEAEKYAESLKSLYNWG